MIGLLLDMYLEIDLGIDQDLEIKGEKDDEHDLEISYCILFSVIKKINKWVKNVIK